MLAQPPLLCCEIVLIWLCLSCVMHLFVKFAAGCEREARFLCCEVHLLLAELSRRSPLFEQDAQPTKQVQLAVVHVSIFDLSRQCPVVSTVDCESCN